MAEVLIVGAGLAGLSVAWHLEGAARVRILEQGPVPGAEASAQNAGMVRRLEEDPVVRSLALQTARRLEALPEDWEGVEVSRVTGALLGLAHDPLHLHDGVAWCREAGVRVEAVDRPAEVAPVLAGAPLKAAWWLPDERVVDPHALLGGLLRGVKRSGGELVCGRSVRALTVEGGRVVGVRTEEGEERADAVVLAAGAWSGALASAAGLSRPLVPLRRSLMTVRAAAPADHPWTWLDDVGLYVRPEGGGWLGSPCDEALDRQAPGPGSQGRLEELHRALMADKLARWIPSLAGAQVGGGWTGLRTFAPDRRPLLGADPALPGLWWAAGLGGFGVTTSLAVGEAVAAAMIGSPVSWLDAAAVAPGRPMLRRWLIRAQGELHRARLVDGLA